MVTETGSTQEQVETVVAKLNAFTKQLSLEEQHVLVQVLANLGEHREDDDVSGHIQFNVLLAPGATLTWNTNTGQVQWRWWW